MKCNNRSFSPKEGGIALVTTLLIMLVASVIGFAAMTTTDIEVRISGNNHWGNQAFYAADGAIEVALADSSNFQRDGENFDLTEPVRASVMVGYDPTQKGAPRGKGISAIHFNFDHYLITSRGYTSVATLSASSQVQEKVIKLVPTAQGGY
ncbi:MAG: pilus assembly PilX N-terminal domain-containing protein [Syntrophobacterales bacterium]|nr:MAG: pilus assembly PilX N-terminal domain-containing protein [Syntrophobacterales bacterium]